MCGLKLGCCNVLSNKKSAVFLDLQILELVRGASHFTIRCETIQSSKSSTCCYLKSQFFGLFLSTLPQRVLKYFLYFCSYFIYYQAKFLYIGAQDLQMNSLRKLKRINEIFKNELNPALFMTLIFSQFKPINN